ncbi:MAG TPA: PAS domain-containing protein [Trichormus sp.]
MPMRGHDDLVNHGRMLANERKLAKIAKLEAEIMLVKGMAAAENDATDSDDRDGKIQPNLSLRNFFASDIIPVCRCDIHGNLFEVNEAWCKLTGYSKDEVQTGQLRWDNITPPEDSYADQLAIAQIKASGKAEPFEKTYICKDGTRKPVLIGVIASDTTGSECFAFAVDMSERRRIEAGLQESEAKFKFLAEAIPQIVWMAEPSGKVTFHNQRYFDYTGQKREEQSTGFEWLAAVFPDDRERFVETVRTASAKAEGFQYEYRYRAKTGEYRWHLTRGTPIFAEGTNELTYFGTCTDIDDQKQLQEELRESEWRFRTLANAIPQIVWTATPDGQIDFFNDRWFEYTGLTYEQSQKDGWRLLLHPDELEDYLRGWKKALATGDSYEAEFRLRRAVGLGTSTKQPYRWHLGRAVALRDSDGGIVKWFATWTEIEDQKQRKP